MKRIALFTSLFVFFACATNSEMEEVNSRIDNLEQIAIATIDQQIAAISNSITGLQATETELQSYIAALQSVSEQLNLAIEVNSKDIEALEDELKSEINTATLEQLEALKILQEELQGKLDAINAVLADLKERDTALENKITALQEYANNELKKSKDWATATFSTLEQYNSTVEEIAGIKAEIDTIKDSLQDLEKSLLEKLEAAIAKTETDLKKWVNEQLTGYYKIAQIDAKVALLQKSIADGDEALSEEINNLKTLLAEQALSITAAYLSAISEAISTNNGIIEGKIQTAVTEVNSRITAEVDTINQKLGVINSRLNGIEQSIAEILAMIQSMVVVPTYSDGAVALGEDETNIFFEVLPVEVAQKLESLALTAFSLKAVSTIQTKSDVDYVMLPIKKVAYEDGLIKVTTTGKEVKAGFFNGEMALNARLSVTDGLNNYSSTFFGLRPQGDLDINNLRIAEYKNKIVEKILMGGGNYIIRFVDGSSIELAQHSFAPRLYLDYDGYWSVSYDNGENISRVVDSEDEYVKVDNLQSESILSVRFIEGNNGRYRLQIYNTSAPDVPSDEVNTPHPIDLDNSLQSIVEDNVNHTVSITVKNGLSFTYKKARIVPTSISVLTNKVYQAEDRTTAVEFRVNPSNASFNYDVSSADCELSLDYVGEATKSNYVTSPTNYKLTRVEQSYDSNGVKKEGQYKAFITDLGVSTTYDELVAFVLTINDGLGQTVQLSSSATEIKYSGNLITEFKFLKADNADVSEDISAFILGNNIIINTSTLLVKDRLIATFKSNGNKVLVNNIEQNSGITINDFSKPLKYIVLSAEGEKNEYNVIVNTSLLPLACINTPDGVDVTSKELYLDNTSLSIVSVDNSGYFNDVGQIKGRGNSTWSAAKKPYAVKFNKKKSLLSMPEDKSWVLLANFFDKTLLRNSVALYMGHEMSLLDWTPHYQQVDLFLNGQYKGVYQLGEKVKISKKRVNVGDDGFLLEVDARASTEDDARYFSVGHIEQVVNIKDPEVEYNDDNFNYAKDFLLAADAALFSDDFLDEEIGYKKYIDVESFVEWYLINEIAKNNDAIFFSSCYMNLKRGGKLKMGPIWDFDLAFGGYWDDERGQTIANVPENYYIKNVLWYQRMFEDPAFVSRVKERFNAIYNNRQQIYDYIDVNSAIINQKIYEENKLWGRVASTTAPESSVQAGYMWLVRCLKEWMETRFEWLHTHINEL